MPPRLARRQRVSAQRRLEVLPSCGAVVASWLTHKRRPAARPGAPLRLKRSCEKRVESCSSSAQRTVCRCSFKRSLSGCYGVLGDWRSSTPAGVTTWFGSSAEMCRANRRCPWTLRLVRRAIRSLTKSSARRTPLECGRRCGALWSDTVVASLGRACCNTVLGWSPPILLDRITPLATLLPRHGRPPAERH